MRWSVATVFFVAVMALSGYYVYDVALRGGKNVEVPDVTGRPLTEAASRLAENGLEVGKQKMVPDERVPRYFVINQRPSPGKVVRTGRKIFLTVSAGVDSLTPPNVVGKTLDKAGEELRASNFEQGNVARIVNNTPRDTVLAQEPGPTRFVPTGARINLLVSDGQPSRAFIMPDIEGKPVQEVLKILTPLNLKPVPNPVNVPGQPVDVVLVQQPPPGTLVKEGDRVVYSLNPSSAISVPDAKRQTRQIAYVVPNSWFEREVRVDRIDADGTRSTLFPLEKHYVNGQPPRFSSGYTILVPPVTYIDKTAIEIYLDGQLAQSYVYEGDNEPAVQQYPVQ